MIPSQTAKRTLTFLFIIAVALGLSIALLDAISDASKGRDALNELSQIQKITQEMRIQYSTAQDAVSTFMFLGSDETWNKAQQELAMLQTLTAQLAANKSSAAKSLQQIARDINRKIILISNKILPLRAIRQDASGVVSGVKASSELQAQYNYGFIAGTSEAMTELEFDSVDVSGDPLFTSLIKAQNLWMRMLSEFRAHMLMRSNESRDAMLLYLDEFNRQWQRFLEKSRVLDDITLESIRQADTNQKIWQENLDKVLRVHASTRWRHDLRYYQDKIRPISTGFLTSLRNYNSLLEEQKNLLNKQQLAYENIVVVWAFVFLVLTSVISTGLLVLYSRLLRSQQQKRLDAERISEMKSGFLSRMSHELRTPLNAIIGFGQLFRLDKEKLDKQHLDYVEEINNASEILLQLVNEVLDLSAIESGKIKFNICPVNLTKILNECSSLVLPMAERLTIHLSNNYDTQKEIIVDADEIRLKQVIMNLLSNAIKYNRKNGQVSISVEPEESIIRVNISDTGIGITDADKSKLFQPFERLAYHEEIEGTGMGLVISKRLIYSMAGDIGVNSNPGEGSTFWIELERPTTVE